MVLLGQTRRWNFLFAFLAVPALLQLCVLPFLPESPRYLLMERRDEARAEKGIQYSATMLYDSIPKHGVVKFLVVSMDCKPYANLDPMCPDFYGPARLQRCLEAQVPGGSGAWRLRCLEVEVPGG
ncbi:hypothetical protein NFI96_010020 [Prochilodus magdalenae]|nr:hypothetical protein NFI96_010020 [Prochilodus magdalenae]